MTDAARQAKTELNGIRYIDIEIDIMLREVERLRALLDVASTGLTAERVQSTRRGDIIPRTVAKIIDLEQQINGYIDQLVDRKAQAEYKLARVSDETQRNIIKLRYFEGKRWEDIAEEMDYSLPWVYRLHDRALKEYSKV